MLLGKHLADCRGFDGAEEEARECKRQKVADILPMHCGQRRYRKTARHFAKQFHTVRAKIDERGHGDAADHHEQSDGLVRQQFLAEDQQSQCRAAEHERACVSLTDVTEEHIHAFPKISVSAFHTKQLWQLRARELQRHASLETDEDSFRDEVHHRTCAR